MPEFDAEVATAARIKQGLVEFYQSRGHSEEDAVDMAERHLKGQTVIPNEPPSE